MLTHPKRSEFHERILFCRRISAQVIDECEYVNGAPAVGFYLDVREFLEMCHARHGKEASAYFATSLTNFAFPPRTAVPSTPSMDPEVMDYFFNQKTDLLSELSDNDRGILMSLYKDDRYLDILCRAQDKQKHSRQG